MAIVWLTNRGNHPGYYKAEHFGKLTTVTTGRVNLFKVDNLAARIMRKLHGRTSAEDYVILSGYIVVNFFVMAYFLLRYGKVRCLQWEGNRNDYTVLHMDIRQFPRELLVSVQGMLNEVLANSETLTETGGGYECPCENQKEDKAAAPAGAVCPGDGASGGVDSPDGKETAEKACPESQAPEDHPETANAVQRPPAGENEGPPSKREQE